MLLENIMLGKTLEIYVDREGYRYRLVSKVEQTGVRRICVTAIRAGGKAFLFKPGDDIRLVYRDEEQMWEWMHVKAGMAKLEGEPVHYFDIVNKGRSFNRRNAYRVRVGEDVEISYYILPEDGKKTAVMPMTEEEYDVIVRGRGVETEATKEEIERGAHTEKRMRIVPMPGLVVTRADVHIKDISETGMGIFSNKRLDIGDNFSLEIPSSYGKLKTRATVIRMDDLESTNNKYRYYYGCIYTESDKRLIRYIFDIQRKTIKKQREKREFEAGFREAQKGKKKDRKK